MRKNARAPLPPPKKKCIVLYTYCDKETFLKITTSSFFAPHSSIWTSSRHFAASGKLGQFNMLVGSRAKNCSDKKAATVNLKKIGKENLNVTECKVQHTWRSTNLCSSWLLRKIPGTLQPKIRDNLNGRSNLIAEFSKVLTTHAHCFLWYK